jgi:hypothetical protein
VSVSVRDESVDIQLLDWVVAESVADIPAVGVERDEELKTWLQPPALWKKLSAFLETCQFSSNFRFKADAREA